MKTIVYFLSTSNHSTVFLKIERFDMSQWHAMTKLETSTTPILLCWMFSGVYGILLSVSDGRLLGWMDVGSQLNRGTCNTVMMVICKSVYPSQIFPPSPSLRPSTPFPGSWSLNTTVLFMRGDGWRIRT